MRGALLILLALAGCASGYSNMKARVSPLEAGAFEECRTYLMARSCQTAETGFYGQEVQFACLSKLADHYATMPSLAERRAFLVDAGCPAPVVRRSLPASTP